MEDTRKYCAFISYRHKDLDKTVAKKLHSMIERYTVPAELRKTWGSKRLGKVFRDEEELPVSSNLTESITEALDHTDYLIVICTPDTPESEWVEREICYFLANHDRSHVIAVLADGTPETSFPKHLTSDFDEKGNVIATYEPLAANLTGVDHKYQSGRMGKEAVRLYAAIMGCHFDSLWQREKRHNLRCVLALMAVIAIVASCYCISIGRRNRMITKANEALSVQIETVQRQSSLLERNNMEIEGQKQHILAQKEELQQQYDEIRQKNRELKEKEAETLLREGELLLEKGDVEGAKNSAVAAVSSEEGREKYADEARFLLARSFSEGHYDNYMQTAAEIEQEDDIAEMRLSRDGKFLYTMDVRGYVRAFSTTDGSQIWKGDSLSRVTHSYVTDRDRLIEIPEEQILLCLNEDAICALSAKDGSRVWSYKFPSAIGTDFFVISPDLTQLALIEGGSGFEKVDQKAILMNTKDGSVKKEFSLKNFFEERSIIASGRECGVFLPDGNSIVGEVYANDSLFTYDDSYIFKIDFKKGKIKLIEHRPPVEHGMAEYYPFVIGMDYQKAEESEAVTIFCYDAGEKKILARQLSMSGEILNEYEYPLNLSSRSVNGMYRTSYHRLGDQVFFTCGKTSFRYHLTEQRFLEIGSGYKEEVLSASCIDQEREVFSYLTVDGLQFLLWGEGGKVIYQFSDKTQLADLVISEDFAYTEKGEFGYKLKENALEAVIRKGELKKAYLLKPDRGPGIESVEWFPDRDVPGLTYNAEMKELPTGEVALFTDMEAEDLFKVTVADPVTDEIKHSYVFDYSSFEPLTVINSKMTKSALWPDQKHLTVLSVTDCGICDLETNEYRSCFDKTRIFASDIVTQENGEVLSAIVSMADDSTFSDPKYEVNYVIGNGEMKTIPLPNGKMPIRKYSIFREINIFLSENGTILLPMGNEENQKPDSYLKINTKDGSSEILSGNDLIASDGILLLGKNSDKIVTAGQESNLLLFGADAKTPVLTIETPYSSVDIASCGFLQEDRKFFVWTKSKIVYVYETETGKLLLEETISWSDDSGLDYLSMFCQEDEARKLLFFVTNNHEVMIVNSESWKVLSEFTGFGAYSERSGEVFRVKNDGMVFGEEMADLIRIRIFRLEDFEKMVKGAEEP